jgi:sigma-B regulation protein RsbU (phosphoserine phosphatase)
VTPGTKQGPPPTAAARDLAAAGQLQRMLLPPSPLVVPGWTAVHAYQPATAVSGDYVDLLPLGDRLYFMLGDVAGKGIAASLLMAQLHAMFRSLIPFTDSLDGLMQRASALLCESSLPAQYATLVSGYLGSDGAVVISNAGHPPPLTVSPKRPQREVEATGVPLGLFCESRFSSAELTLRAGDTLLVYSDGLSEARNPEGEEYGAHRIRAALADDADLPPTALLDRMLARHSRFRRGEPNTDDLTVLAIRRE